MNFVPATMIPVTAKGPRDLFRPPFHGDLFCAGLRLVLRASGSSTFRDIHREGSCVRPRSRYCANPTRTLLQRTYPYIGARSALIQVWCPAWHTQTTSAGRAPPTLHLWAIHKESRLPRQHLPGLPCIVHEITVARSSAAWRPADRPSLEQSVGNRCLRSRS